MTIAQLKSAVKTAASNTLGIAACVHDWVSVIDENPSQEYDLLLFVPPRGGRTKRGASFRDYTCQFYLFRQKAINGNSMTSDERDAAWGELQTTAESFIDKLTEDRQTILLDGSEIITPDEGHIGQDDLVWVKVDVKLKTLIPC